MQGAKSYMMLMLVVTNKTRDLVITHSIQGGQKSVVVSNCNAAAIEAIDMCFFFLFITLYTYMHEPLALANFILFVHV